MKIHLFLFTLGPVQSFISQARKTRDLYAGSQILSDLIKAALGAFQREVPDGEVIFPHADMADKQSNIPNRFVARVSAKSTEELRRKGDAIERAVRERWRKMANRALAENSIELPEKLRKQFDAQVEDLLEIYWLFTPLTEEYAESYRRLERLGGAIKNIRPFNQLVEQGIKCSLDGRYNALFFAPDNQRTSQGVRVRNRFLVGPTEGLSAVSFVKRTFRPKDGKFPSTSTIALLEDIQQLNKDGKYVYDCFKNLFKKEKVPTLCIELFKNGLLEEAELADPQAQDDWCEDFDDHFLFEENLNDKYIPNKFQLRLLKELLAKKLQEGRLKDKLKTRYYAMLMFDGDQIGKWMNGDFLKESTDLLSFHRDFSKLLGDYAKGVREYLNAAKGNGQVIYAGGDDFLGMVNIYHLFDVVKYLRETFYREVDAGLSSYKKEGKHLTFSAGIVIAHYKSPYSEVLKKLREVGRKAKRVGDRNAFCIAVMKHSGEIQEALYKWDEKPHSPDGLSNWKAMQCVFEGLAASVDGKEDEGKFSNTFIQHLTWEIEDLMGVDMMNPKGSELMEEEAAALISKEIERLVARSWKKYDVTGEEEKKEIQTMSEQVKKLYLEQPKDLPYRPKNFVHALHIADFLTRKTTGAL